MGLASLMAGAPAGAGELGHREAALIDATGAADFVLLGEATHGTSEFYSERAGITERLAEDARTGAVVIEADGTEVERVNRYVRGTGPDRSAGEALAAFRRFPRWMWRNAEFARFVERLRAINLRRPEASRVGLYGMDVYDLFGALDRAGAYLRRHGSAAAVAAAEATRCFAPFRRSGEAYGTASRQASRSCAARAEAMLEAVKHSPYGAEGEAAEERFAAIQAAAAVVSGEAYFRAAYAGSYSWNVRERAMAQAIERVAEHVGAARQGSARVVVWTHNSHVAAAASTAMADRGEVSIADLLRAQAPGRVFTLGFLTHSGSFMAAPAWDRPGKIFRLEPAARNSVEGLLRRSGEARSMLMLHGGGTPPALADWRPQRGIGAVYDPSPGSAYSRARLATEFDAVIFIAETGAVSPLR